MREGGNEGGKEGSREEGKEGGREGRKERGKKVYIPIPGPAPPGCCEVAPPIAPGPPGAPPPYRSMSAGYIIQR